ncbi:hypothetical protein ACS15_3092 [Ralstonia insidiosa]|uniref:Uncharacterized protein n=2 Tax=Ralstonia insidiosa TaxID=190721 RepID=A0AAC9BIF1_9RALS|nr:hypothetical protein ACS15_3092 [Ralstonia insidiosa]GAQ27341.1 hypothetical protein SAMD00023378_1024 [Ralstonia sp. NT80]
MIHMKNLAVILVAVGSLIYAMSASAFRDQDQQHIIDKAMKEKKAAAAQSQPQQRPVLSASAVGARSGHP